MVRKRKNPLALTTLPKEVRESYALLEGASVGLFEEASMRIGISTMNVRPKIGCYYNIAVGVVKGYIDGMLAELGAKGITLDKMHPLQLQQNALLSLSYVRVVFKEAWDIGRDIPNSEYARAYYDCTPNAVSPEWKDVVNSMLADISSEMRFESLMRAQRVLPKKPKIIHDNFVSTLRYCAHFAETHDIPFKFKKGDGHLIDVHLREYFLEGCPGYIQRTPKETEEEACG